MYAKSWWRKRKKGTWHESAQEKTNPQTEAKGEKTHGKRQHGMSYILQIVGCEQTAMFDKKYVKAYDPTRSHGLFNFYIEVTDDPNDALKFPDVRAAIEKWRESYGLRPDGKPNRPLTAFTVTVETVEDVDDVA
jgi:hypothetical protein